VSTFAEIGAPMAADAHDLAHPVLDALAGNQSARWAVRESTTPVELVHADKRPPETDLLLLDADSEQEQVIASIAAGNSIVVKTLPGTGGTQTVVNAVGALVAQNKRVLVVSPRRATLRAIAARQPRALDDLDGVAGIGQKKREAYGEDVLRIVRPFIG